MQPNQYIQLNKKLKYHKFLLLKFKNLIIKSNLKEQRLYNDKLKSSLFRMRIYIYYNLI